MEDILLRNAIVPRYCKEDLEYLKICNEGAAFSEIYVLQKCFCDIPFHKLTEQFQLQPTGENYQELNEGEKINLNVFDKSYPISSCLCDVRYKKEEKDKCWSIYKGIFDPNYKESIKYIQTKADYNSENYYAALT